MHAVLLGVSPFQSSHIHAVVDNCTKALENNPRYVKALTRRTKAYDAAGRKSDALLGGCGGLEEGRRIPLLN